MKDIKNIHRKNYLYKSAVSSNLMLHIPTNKIFRFTLGNFLLHKNNLTNHNDSKNLINAFLSTSASFIKLFLLFSASPPCQRIASERFLALPSCKKF